MATASIGGLTVSNPLQLTNTTAPKTTTAPKPYTGASKELYGPISSYAEVYGTPMETISSPYETLEYMPDSYGNYPGGTNPAYIPAVDPYAQWGGKANYDTLLADWNTQQGNTMSSIDQRGTNDANTYHSGILDYVDSAKSGQAGIDAQTVQNELSKLYGTRGVQDMIGHGLKSAGVMLANKPGASTSSAGGAIARAYADIGGREMNKVGNQYESGNAKIATAQEQFGAGLATGARHLEENKTSIVNNIVADAQTQLAALNAQAANASLPDRIDIEAKKQEIRSSTLGKLQAFDGEIASARANAKGVDRKAAAGTAYGQAQAGTQAANPFQFTDQMPAQFQNTGPFAADLPLFSMPNSRKEFA